MPNPYRYTSPVPRKAAAGLVAAVYAQIGEDFILADGPLMSLSPAPELLAATWALLREAQVVGDAPRVDKEMVAAAVSAANHCQFCVDAHTALIHAGGDHRLAEEIWSGQEPADPDQAQLVAWAKATGSAERAASTPWPFPSDHAAEYLGTALVSHVINRMVASLLHDTLLPGRLGESSLVRRIAGRTLGRTMRLHPRPGLSLPLLGNVPLERPDWAGETPIGQAYAALRAVASAGGDLLSVPAREIVRDSVAAWDGSNLARRPGWLEERLTSAPPSDRHGVDLALLAALAPHRVGDSDVAAWRASHPADADLIRVVAFGAMTAVDRIQEWMSAAMCHAHEADDRQSVA
jgi:AhpD family alkylhydroperoxidase